MSIIEIKDRKLIINYDYELGKTMCETVLKMSHQLYMMAGVDSSRITDINDDIQAGKEITDELFTDDGR
jgi:hypothetical protein